MMAAGEIESKYDLNKFRAGREPPAANMGLDHFMMDTILIR